MTCPENIKEYLAGAITEAEELEREALALSELKLKSENLSRSLSSAIKTRDKDIKNTVSSKRKEITREADLKIAKAKKELSAKKDQKIREKKKKVSEKIGVDTSYLRKENEELKRRFSSLFRENRIPAFCRSGIYYALFMPKGLKEYLIAALSFAFVFAVLPFVAIMLFPNMGLFLFAFLYLALIFVFGGAYVFIANSTRHKSPEVFKEGRAFMNQINENKRRMRGISKSIKKDPDETKYNLSEFDEKINQAEEALAAANEEKKKALDFFDDSTAPELTREITEKAQGEISSLEEKMRATDSELSSLTASHEERDKKFHENYTPVFGGENLSPLKLKRLKAILESEEGIGLEEALKKL